jgi:gamma-glutamyltranspeptidase
VRKELTTLGHNVQVRRLGNAHGLTIAPERFISGADPRGEGKALGR